MLALVPEARTVEPLSVMPPPLQVRAFPLALGLVRVSVPVPPCMPPLSLRLMALSVPLAFRVPPKLFRFGRVLVDLVPRVMLPPLTLIVPVPLRLPAATLKSGPAGPPQGPPVLVGGPAVARRGPPP